MFSVFLGCLQLTNLTFKLLKLLMPFKLSTFCILNLDPILSFLGGKKCRNAQQMWKETEKEIERETEKEREKEKARHSERRILVYFGKNFGSL